MGGNAKIVSESYIWGFDLLMILVLLGTQNNSFHRLLEKMDELIEKGIIDEKVDVDVQKDVRYCTKLIFKSNYYNFLF